MGSWGDSPFFIKRIWNGTNIKNIRTESLARSIKGYIWISSPLYLCLFSHKRRMWSILLNTHIYMTYSLPSLFLFSIFIFSQSTSFPSYINPALSNLHFRKITIYCEMRIVGWLNDFKAFWDSDEAVGSVKFKRCRWGFMRWREQCCHCMCTFMQKFSVGSIEHLQIVVD